HFETRVGLLTALYEQVDRRQTDAAKAALESDATSLSEAAAILAAAYIDCVLLIGKEHGAITAALSANAELTGVLEEGRRRYAREFLAAIERFTDRPIENGEAVMIGVVGAAESLARATADAQLDRKSAVAALTNMIVAAGTPR